MFSTIRHHCNLSMWSLSNVYFDICMGEKKTEQDFTTLFETLFRRHVLMAPLLSSGASLVQHLLVWNFTFCNVTASLHHFCFHFRCFPTSCLYCMGELWEKIPVRDSVSQRLVSSNPSLSLLIASLYCAHSNTSGSIFVSISCWITGAMQKTIWHDVVLKWASLCDAVLPCLL